jgi:excisionase family DNA binding protein
MSLILEDKMKNNDVILKPQEAANYFRISIRTLQKLCNEGKVPATRVGKHWRFRKEEIDKWFDENNVFGKRD